ncbi:Binary cytotoxin component [Pseudomonas syringae pv. antirrhini]|uniref:Binary cytotoxin component n=1 Tax=Pseudomonas syringae pv. antirrhini TaxID=251702 RepID=A0A0P9P2M5_9PSED|nr:MULTISPECIES: alpha-xenorhabdolysin family binary toxin subunit B [Pseudomonas]KPW51035.1 Binary cytotoxin component [Pseudomonas syringae pv. antirrhini]RMP37530.1 Binary cytotoxin component [Pseudomonas syringae pv. antirrhini]RMP38793.1 Binary cytotoxin component [Pseudomonas syringae pv. antirrhini]WIN06335.1 alpha-xenorhabdolysin family binary toxin subunit B [Pseudomonas syringae pv. antirrhini str. 126]
MNVHVLDTPFQLPQPDMEIIIGSREKLKHQADALGDIYLPVMKETLRSLVNEIGNVDKEALDTLTLVPHFFNDDEMLPFVEAIATLRGEPDEAKSKTAILEFNEEISMLLDARTASLASQAKALDKALSNLNAVQVNAVDHLTPALDQEISTLQARLAIEKTRLEEMLAKEKVVNALIADVESLSFFDKLKPLIASLETLADIDPKNPLIGSIKAGIAGVSNMLDLLDGAVDYDHLMTLRDTLQAQLLDLQGRVGEARAALDVEVSKRDQISGLASVQVYKNDYVREIGKLHTALTQVLANCRLPASEGLEERVSHFRRQADALNTYLVDLRGSWRS